MEMNACIKEVFSSIQGEGVYVGEKMTFVRFANCGLGCKWCDTDHHQAKMCNVHLNDEEVIYEKNPIGIVKLKTILDRFDNKFISITGGEPLEQTDFLENFLPSLHMRNTVFLETNGVHYNELSRITQFIDVISMDIKLPSSAGIAPLWNEHKKFIEAGLSSGKELYAKLVVTEDTSDKDINEAIKLLTSTNRHIQTIIQPVTPTDDFQSKISDKRLSSLERLFSAWLPNVTVAPQMHHTWGVK